MDAELIVLWHLHGLCAADDGLAGSTRAGFPLQGMLLLMIVRRGLLWQAGLTPRVRRRPTTGRLKPVAEAPFRYRVPLEHLVER